jgi:hypothetical protein
VHVSSFEGDDTPADTPDVNTKYNRSSSARFAVAFTALLTTIFIGRPAAADTINLAWDANPEAQVVGYIVHVGTQASTYTQHVDVGPATAWAFASAVAGQQYCFAVSAYFAGPTEGPKSTEICGFGNAPPALVNPGAQSSTVGQPDTLQLAGSDPKGDPVTYTATGLPPGLTLMASTGFISGNPTTTGTYSVTARVSDGVLTASQTFTWTVTMADATAPTVSITGPTSAATYATTGPTLTLSGSASDAVGVTQVSWVNSRGGSGTASGTASWTASVALQGGSNVVTVTARDAAGNTSADALTVTANGPPTIGSVANQSSAVGFSTTLQLVGSDPNGDALIYSATGLPSGMTVGASSGLIAGTPSVVGTYSATVSVSDGALSASRAFTWTIVASDTTAPVVTITGPTSAATVVVSSSAMSLSGTASDGVGVTQVSWANNRGGSGTATGTANWSAAGVALQSGSNVLTVTARDAAGNTSTDVLSVTYSTADVNAPTVSITAPTSAASYMTTASQVALSGTAVDETGVTSVTWSNDRGGTGVASQTAATGAQGLLAHWRLDEGVGTAAGSTTGALTGTLANGASWVAGRHGQAVNLDGIDDFVAVPSMDVAGTGLTIAGWVKSSSFPAYLDQRFVSKSTDAGEQSHYWMVGQTNNGQNRLRFRLKAGGTTTTLIASSGSLPLNTWYHVAATYDGAMMRLYLDGVEVGAIQKTGTLATSAAVPVNIGRNPDGSNPMHGAIDDFRVYGRALSASEIGAVLQAPDTAGPAWNASSVALQPGANVVTVMARDGVGNESSDVVTVTMKVAPTLASVADQSAEQGRTVTLQLSGVDPDGDTLTFGAMGLPPGLGVVVSSGLITGTPTTPGSYPVSVTVSDETQTATRTFTWTVTPEMVAPAVAITSPTSTTTFASTKSTVTLRGSASDNIGVTQVTWRSDRGGSGAATGTNSWSVTGVALQAGVNVLTVTARDAAGNTSSDVLTVTYAPPVHVASLTADRVAPQRLGTTVTFTAVAAGGTAPYEYQWRVYNGTKWVTVSGWSSNNQFVWTPTTATSLYQVRAVVRSATMTTAMKTVSFPIVP